jgi:hypothetical protein
MFAVEWLRRGCTRRERNIRLGRPLRCRRHYESKSRLGHGAPSARRTGRLPPLGHVRRRSRNLQVPYQAPVAQTSFAQVSFGQPIARAALIVCRCFWTTTFFADALGLLLPKGSRLSGALFSSLGPAPTDIEIEQRIGRQDIARYERMMKEEPRKYWAILQRRRLTSMRSSARRLRQRPSRRHRRPSVRYASLKAVMVSDPQPAELLAAAGASWRGRCVWQS